MSLSPKREELNHWNWTYMAMQSGAGHGEMDAINLVLANNEVEPPQTGSEFRAYLEGIHVLDVGTTGVALREEGDGGRPAIPRGGGAKRLPVHLLNQNCNLRDAWMATGHTSIFCRENAPFRNPTARDGKKVVLSDTPNPYRPGKQRICIPMACTGRCYSNCNGKHTVLNTAEVNRVATTGGFNVA
jgi:hypothetical protein